MNREISVKESQEIELAIMQELHSFCQKHGLRYLLAYGTLIGAIRHKGFIPWDNDMDIFMPRPDFEKFMEITKTEPVGEHYYIKHYTNDEKYHYNCARVCDARTQVTIPYIPVQPNSMGIWVDIFAVDGLPADSFWQRVQRSRVRTAYYALRAHIYGTLDNKNQLRKIVKLACLKFVSNRHQRLNKRITALEKKYDFNTSLQTAVLWVDKFVLIPRADFDHPRLVPFEQYEFYVPEHYDQILKDTYGNYMELPEESKRITHGIEAYWVQED